MYITPLQPVAHLGSAELRGPSSPALLWRPSTLCFRSTFFIFSVYSFQVGLIQCDHKSYYAFSGSRWLTEGTNQLRMCSNKSLSAAKYRVEPKDFAGWMQSLFASEFWYAHCCSLERLKLNYYPAISQSPSKSKHVQGVVRLVTRHSHLQPGHSQC